MTDNGLQWKHEKFLYPVVRIYSKTAAGSGTIIYSKTDPDNEGEYLSFVLTNHHVVADCIEYKDDWDSVLKKTIKKEFLEIPRVEVFDYVNQSTVNSSNAYRSEIVAYDKNHDLAVLRIDSPKEFPFVAELIPKDEIKDLRLFAEIVISGCTMAHEPFTTFGQLTFLKEIILQKLYLMYNAGSYFGNSGGALLLAETGQLIGVPSRLTGIQLGFGVDMVTHMGFGAHPGRIYEFLAEQELQFFWREGETYKDALDKREARKKDALLALKAELAKEGE